jgi:hypothetical protein
MLPGNRQCPLLAQSGRSISAGCVGAPFDYVSPAMSRNPPTPGAQLRPPNCDDRNLSQSCSVAFDMACAALTSQSGFRLVRSCSTSVRLSDVAKANR